MRLTQLRLVKAARVEEVIIAARAERPRPFVHDCSSCRADAVGDSVIACFLAALLVGAAAYGSAHEHH
jgi:hypothetical protein